MRSSSPVRLVDFVDLPGGFVFRDAVLTLEFWATFGANGAGAQVIDFGNMNGSSEQDLLLTVRLRRWTDNDLAFRPPPPR